jgi:hypothetical protein
MSPQPIRKNNDKNRIVFQGGVNTVIEDALLPDGSFSQILNMRSINPGFEGRGGQSRLHTTTDAAQEIVNLGQYIDKAGTINTYAQRADGTVHKATNNPPTVTTGNFGSAAISAPTSIANLVPASFSTLGDTLLFSDGARQHMVYSGDGARITGFFKYVSAATIPIIPQKGVDYTFQVGDDDSATYADISSLDNSNDAIFICTPIPAKKLTVTILAANGNASTLTMAYWRNDTSNFGFNPVAISDGTASGGATMAQSGDITWTPQTDEVEHYLFGRVGFWYRLVVSATLDASVQISKVTYESNYVLVQNVWDGVFLSAVEAQVERCGKSADFGGDDCKKYIYGGDAVDVSALDDGAYIYAAFIDPITFLYIDASASPNITSLVLESRTDLSFHDEGSGDDEDYIYSESGEFANAGFEEGMTVTVSGSTSNNVTEAITSISSTKMKFPAGTLSDEASGDTVTITLSNATAINQVAGWSGTAWGTASSLTDNTNGLSEEGIVTMQKVAVEKMQFNNATTPFYWYRFKLDKKTTNAVSISIRGMPYYDIEDILRDGVCNTAWKGRPVWSNGDQWINVGAKNLPMTFNGSDFAVLEMGDGRDNQVLAMRPYYSDLMVWQEEEGQRGGCVTIVQGYDPTTFGMFRLDSKIGIMNNKCVAVVSGARSISNTKHKNQTIPFWLSRQGVYATDGQGVINMSLEIGNYFDPTKTECVNTAYKDKMWLFHDTSKNVLRIGLVTGSATVPDAFPVLNLADYTWSFDTLGQVHSCAAEIQAATAGSTPIVQIAGGSADGFVYLLNTGTNDVGASTVAISNTVTVEFDSGGLSRSIMGLILRCKAQAAGDITATVARDGNSTYNTFLTFPMTARTTNDVWRREKKPTNETSDHLSIKLVNTTASQTMYLLDLISETVTDDQYQGAR